MLLYFHQMLVLLENQMCSSGHYPPVCFPHHEFEHLLKAASTTLAAAPATPCRLLCVVGTASGLNPLHLPFFPPSL